MATKKSEGRRIDYTPGTTVSAGDEVVLNDIVGVATEDIAANELGALDIEGVFEFAKDTGSGTDIAAGEIVYWDAGSEFITTTSAGNTRAGKAIAAAATTAEVVSVKIGV
jgi:predicted RecA/RadA family phage recombinase